MRERTPILDSRTDGSTAARILSGITMSAHDWRAAAVVKEGNAHACRDGPEGSPRLPSSSLISRQFMHRQSPLKP
jgi:hypothetical protein